MTGPASLDAVPKDAGSCRARRLRTHGCPPTIPAPHESLLHSSATHRTRALRHAAARPATHCASRCGCRSRRRDHESAGACCERRAARRRARRHRAGVRPTGRPSWLRTTGETVPTRLVPPVQTSDLATTSGAPSRVAWIEATRGREPRRTTILHRNHECSGIENVYLNPDYSPWLFGSRISDGALTAVVAAVAVPRYDELTDAGNARVDHGRAASS
jgi:hypothetical protein